MCAELREVTLEEVLDVGVFVVDDAALTALLLYVVIASGAYLSFHFFAQLSIMFFVARALSCPHFPLSVAACHHPTPRLT